MQFVCFIVNNISWIFSSYMNYCFHKIFIIPSKNCFCHILCQVYFYLLLQFTSFLYLVNSTFYNNTHFKTNTIQFQTLLLFCWQIIGFTGIVVKSRTIYYSLLHLLCVHSNTCYKYSLFIVHILVMIFFFKRSNYSLFVSFNACYCVIYHKQNKFENCMRLSFFNL